MKCYVLLRQLAVATIPIKIGSNCTANDYVLQNE